MSDKKNSSIGNMFTSVTNTVGKTVNGLTGKAGELMNDGAKRLTNLIDANGDGTIEIDDFIILGLRIPGVGVNREAFLRAELKRDFPKEVIEQAILTTPAQAGITVDEADKLADAVIAYERNCVTGISAALGMPGGFAMAATIPTDIAQYYGFMLRAAQKLMYLYGFPQIDVSEKEQTFDSETMNVLTLCLGVMYGVAGANSALKAMANALAKGVEKKLLNAVLTKGTLYPIVKNVAKWFGKKMTKQVFAGFFKKAIPVVGGVLGGSITYLSFKPCCDKLKESLKDTMLSNPNGYKAEKDDIIIE
ncbi:MAG: EcsC family protein [Clostridia bacterium]|nr:EcsC family protein [Clostridia bacterium]